MSISKADLVNKIAQKNKDYYKYIIRSVVDDVFEEIADALRDGEKVSIYGFGNFDVKTFKSHPASHPITRETIIVPDYQNVVFKPGQELLRGVRIKEEKKTA